MTPISEVEFRLLSWSALTPTDLSPAGLPGDWAHPSMPFGPPFPGDDPGRVHVFLTACDHAQIPEGAPLAFPVCVATRVTTAGFMLAARNAAAENGFAAYGCLAVMETPGRKAQRRVRLAAGALRASAFGPAGAPGCQRDWLSPYGAKFAQPPLVLVTASNSPALQAAHHAAAVGIVRKPTATGFWLRARSADRATGACAFHFVAAAHADGPAQGDELWVDTGSVGPADFGPEGSDGAWADWGPLPFGGTFLSPPVVLVTAHDRGASGYLPAVVGLARDVTEAGFRLAARNTDLAGGQAGLSWVAFGRAKGG